MKSAMNVCVGSLCLAFALGSLQIACGGEPPCECPAAAAQRMVKVWINGNWAPVEPACPAASEEPDHPASLLSKLPFVGRLMIVRSFSKSGEETNCDERVELSGKEPVGEKLIVREPPVLHRMVRQVCPSCKMVLTTEITTSATRTAECCSGCCEAAACQAATHVAACAELPCPAAAACCAAQEATAHRGPGPDELWHHIAKLAAEKAAAEARLEAREESHLEWAELYEAMAELMADNAALDAQLEAQNENRKTAGRVRKLAAENERLKAEMQLTAAKAEAMQHTLGMALENERLKLRIAQLEQQHAVDDAARTASRPRIEQR
jgi:hypothetical protein